MKMNPWPVILVISTVTLGVSGQLYDHLYKRLMRGYQKDVMPRLTLNATIPVKFNLQLITVDELNARYNFLKIEVWVVTSWVDHRLSWDPASFDNVETMALPSNKVWAPDISLYNGASAVKAHNVRTIVYSDGSIFYYVPTTIRTPCSISTRDPTTCTIKFGSWVYNGHELDLDFQNEDDPKVDLADYEENLDYDIVRNTARRNVVEYQCCPEPYIDLMYSLTFAEAVVRRKK